MVSRPWTGLYGYEAFGSVPLQTGAIARYMLAQIVMRGLLCVAVIATIVLIYRYTQTPKYNGKDP